ncbi:zinc-dependent metalloprotease [Sphingomonas sp. ASY06-1R]|uniref:zinc-dependent metalloprotease n=1 Tax=Sphingomonas sp. ASY06-1R TaxID=3445771 RepID=UPI003FA322ED
MKRAYLVFAAALLATSALAAPPASSSASTLSANGLLPVQIDKSAGKILLTLPAADADGIAGRFLYATSLRTGIGSAELNMDRGFIGNTYLLVFRRIGGKVAIQYENPRFRASNAPAAEQAAARDSFAFTTAWIGKVDTALPNGGAVIDIAPFLAGDVMGVGAQLAQAGAKGFQLDPALSVVDAGATKVFPDNIELEALQTFNSDTPGSEIENIAPNPRQISLIVHHSLVRLPDAGFTPRRFDPRMGTFGTQAVDFGAPLGAPVVYDLATRFRLEKTDPAAARSTVKKPIIFYIDNAAPAPIRDALAKGVSWWSQAFDAAGYIDAFQVKILPPDVDPMDVRYNVVNWVDRATRGWSFGQAITDPRTGEIIKGAVVLGALRVRQDILIYEGLVGSAGLNGGGPNDPVRVALARISQLGAHEVGHSLGFAHNFAASTQDRASVMDYPPPRIGMKDGAPDLSDAYAVGIGRWDKAAVDWLYGTDSDAVAKTKADAAEAAGLRYITDGDARGADVGQPWAALWDDGADPVAELTRILTVRRAALDRFGMGVMTPGEPMAQMRRKLVPIWLLHRYQVDAAAKSLGGLTYTYAVAGAGHQQSAPVPAGQQRAALTALLATLDPQALHVPDRLVPLLSAGAQGSYDKQYEIEIFAEAGGPVFDPLVATDVAARVTLDALLAPARLTRLLQQHERDAGLPGLDEMVDRLTAGVVDKAQDEVGQRIAWRTIVRIAQARRDSAGDPNVAAVLDNRLRALADRLAAMKAAWAGSLARTLRNRDDLNALLDAQKDKPSIPPGMPIGDSAEYMDLR